MLMAKMEAKASGRPITIPEAQARLAEAAKEVVEVERRLAELTEELGRAEALGDMGLAAKLRADYEEALNAERAVRRHQAVAEATLRAARERVGREMMAPLTARQEEIRMQWAKTATRLRKASQALVEAWEEHEAIFHEHEDLVRQIRQTARHYDIVEPEVFRWPAVVCDDVLPIQAMSYLGSAVQMLNYWRARANARGPVPSIPRDHLPRYYERASTGSNP